MVHCFGGLRAWPIDTFSKVKDEGKRELKTSTLLSKENILFFIFIFGIKKERTHKRNLRNQCPMCNVNRSNDRQLKGKESRANEKHSTKHGTPSEQRNPTADDQHHYEKTRSHFFTVCSFFCGGAHLGWYISETSSPVAVASIIRLQRKLRGKCPARRITWTI